MCAKCDKVQNPRYFYITRMAALELLRMVEQRQYEHGMVVGMWWSLKTGVSILLPTGAKLFRDNDGNMGIYGYAWDNSDIDPYRQYELRL